MISDLAERIFHFVQKGFALLFAFFLVFSAPMAFAEMSSTNYLLQWDSISVGAHDSQSSSSYRLRSSFDAGVSADDFSSSSYRLDGGYRGGVYDPVSTFRIYVQDRTSQVAAIAYTSTTVTVTSASGFSSGDRILVVQNEGVSQTAAMGKVTSITDSTLTVDTFAGVALSIDSSNDYVYRMTADGTSLPLGTPTPSTVITGAVGWEATADVQTGYSVYIAEDGNLRTGSGNVIADVSDGVVSAGASEYGAQSSDTTLASSSFDAQDTGITSSPQLIASRAAVSFSERDFLTLKLGIDSAQAAGSYSQNLYVLFAGNY